MDITCHSLSSTTKCTDQNYMSFKDFYETEFIGSNSLLVKQSKNILKFILYSETINDSIKLIGYSSHERICIVDGDKTYDETFLIINFSGYDDNYILKFLLPMEILSWDDAWVEISVRNYEELYRKIIECLQIRERHKV